MKIKKITLFFIVFILINFFGGCNKFNDNGKVVFFKKGAWLNCGPENIIITVNNDCVGILYTVSDSIVIEKPVGAYNYRAELVCSKHNKIGYWENSFEIKKDSCTKIELNLFDTIQPFYYY
jgi:hypothetical protein